MEEFGRIPVEGDYFTYQNLTVKVTKTNHRHALEVLVTVHLPIVNYMVRKMMNSDR